MHIRHLATSFSGSLVAAGEFEHTVHFWDIDEARNIAAIDTVLDFGGRRLAITNDGKQCVAAAYHAGGIASYSTTNSGLAVWHRADLKAAQAVKFSADGQRVICCFDNKPYEELDRHTGDTIRKSAGIQNCWESSYESIRLVERRGLILENADGQKLCNVQRETFAVLSVTFGPSLMCISESGGPIRSFDTGSGKELWRFTPELGHHFLELGFVEHANFLAGVCWPYEHGGPKQLVCFESTSGEVSSISDLGNCGECAFCLRGSRLLLANGALIDSITGEIVKQIPTNSRSACQDA